MQYARHDEGEFRDFDLEMTPLGAGKSVAAAHRSDRGRNLAGAGVVVGFAGCQYWLLANDAEAAHFLHMSVRVGDDPVPGDQLCRLVARVFNVDGVGENVALFVGRRVLRLVIGRGVDADTVACRHGSECDVFCQLGSVFVR